MSTTHMTRLSEQFKMVPLLAASQYLMAACLLALGVSLAEFKEDNDDGSAWKEIHYQVYALEGHRLEPARVLENLELLEKIYAGKQDKGSIIRRAKIEPLIEASRLAETKCDWSSFNKLDLLLEYNKPFALNLVPYLEDCRLRQFALCKPLLAASVSRAVAKLSEQETMDSALLMDSVKRTVPDMDRLRTSLARVSLRDGISTFLTRRYSQLQEPWAFADKEMFEELFDKTVVRLCRTVARGLGEPTKVYDLYIHDASLSADIDQFSLNWYRRAKLCRNILFEASFLTDLIYEDLKSRLES